MTKANKLYELLDISRFENKSAQEIKSIIRGLKNKITRLKNKMEHPNYKNSEEITFMGENIYIRQYRENMLLAKDALRLLGEEYEPTKSEKRIIELENSLKYISKIVFTIGGYFNGYDTLTYEIKDNIAYGNIKNSIRDYEFDYEKHSFPNEYLIKKSDLIIGLEQMHIFEWQRNYRRYEICDGTQWSIEISFSNGCRKFKSDGDNFYPYNFKRLCELLHYDLVEEDEDSEEEDD